MIPVKGDSHNLGATWLLFTKINKTAGHMLMIGVLGHCATKNVLNDNKAATQHVPLFS